MAKRTVELNPYLIKKQKISEKNINKLYRLHRELDKYINKLQKAKDTKSKKCERYIENSGKKIQDIEFKMQKEWKFNKDETSHTHWTRNPFCSCSLSNNDFGLKNNYSLNCKVHSPKLYGKYFNSKNTEIDTNSLFIADLTSITDEQKKVVVPLILSALKKVTE